MENELAADQALEAGAACKRADLLFERPVKRGNGHEISIPVFLTPAS
jgi:hypothetical protein